MEKTLGIWRVSIQRIPPTETELVGMYNDAARYWHHSSTLLGYPRAYTNLFDRLQVSGLLQDLQHGGHVLDCGIGTAAFSLALTRKMASQVQIDGVDISSQMLETARQLLSSEGVNAQLHCCDVRHLPFDDNTFDLVMCAHMLEHLSDPFTGLREMMRVLRPGAPLLIVVTRQSAIDAFIRLKWRYQTFERSQLVNWMEQAGMSEVRLYELAAHASLAYWTSIACSGWKTETRLPNLNE